MSVLYEKCRDGPSPKFGQFFCVWSSNTKKLWSSDSADSMPIWPMMWHELHLDDCHSLMWHILINSWNLCPARPESMKAIDLPQCWFSLSPPTQNGTGSIERAHGLLHMRHALPYACCASPSPDGLAPLEESRKVGQAMRFPRYSLSLFSLFIWIFMEEREEIKGGYRKKWIECCDVSGSTFEWCPSSLLHKTTTPNNRHLARHLPMMRISPRRRIDISSF